MFLVQLAALALWTANRTDPPEESTGWADLLRGLTPDHAEDEPWRMVVEDRASPAFLQPPADVNVKWLPVPTPDELDVLICARNHDIKQSIARDAAMEDWLFSLVSLQTSAGFDGRGNYGIARMNGGSSSRPMLGLAPAQDENHRLNPSAWWLRDVQQLVARRLTGGGLEFGRIGGPALLWCLDWPQGEQLHLRTLDPWFIEVCRRVRLVGTARELSVIRANSTFARIEAKSYHGHVGDPWAPVHRREGKSLTLGSGDFDYRKLSDLMFGGAWHIPALATLGSDERAGERLLVAEALSRGQSKTEGFKSRVVPVPNGVVRLLNSRSAATLAAEQMVEINAFDEALRHGLVLMAARGDSAIIGARQYGFATTARDRFDRTADRLFFPHLWARLAAQNSDRPNAVEESAHEFRRALFDAASAELAAALPGVPCAQIHRPRAEARAWRAFDGRVKKLDASLFRRFDNRIAFMRGPEDHPVQITALAIEAMLRGFDVRRLAELRRVRASAGVPGFWRLAARHPDTIARRQPEWLAFLRILAILTPTCDADNRRPLHNPNRRLGEVFCDGGDPAWPPSRSRRPVLSEQRLALLMAARGNHRHVLLERAARAINRTLQPGSGINIVDLAWTLLDSDPGQAARQLAEPYYARLDRAHRGKQTT